jgi:CelD/BcsL family acetyltransferase involved in cellulose biosynthesis
MPAQRRRPGFWPPVAQRVILAPVRSCGAAYSSSPRGKASVRAAAADTHHMHIDRRLTREWEELADLVAAPPFMRPGWFQTWCEAFGRPRIELLTARRNDRLVGVLPMLGRKGSLRAPTNYHSPGFEPLAADEGATYELARNLVSAAGGRLSVGLLGDDDALLRRCETAATAAGWRVASRVERRTPVIRLEGGGRSHLERLPAKFRKELRRVRRRLEEQGVVSFDASNGDHRLTERLEEVLAVENSGWKRDRGTAIASAPDTRSFYVKLARWAAGRGFLRLFVLRLDGAPIAVDYGLEDQGVRYLLKGGFDPRYASYSPGTLLLEDGLAHAVQTGVSEVDLGGGSDAYKLRWTSTVRTRVRLEAFAPSIVGLVGWSAHQFGRPTAVRMRSTTRTLAAQARQLSF